MPDILSDSVTADAEWFEYSQAANPIRPSLTPPVPFRAFLPELYAAGPTRLVPLDLSEALHCEGPATSPGLAANFARILPGESLAPEIEATSQVFYVIRGSGCSVPAASDLPRIAWQTGDIVALPGGARYRHEAGAEGGAFYLVHDAPLLAYLGVRVDRPRFAPTLYPVAHSRQELLRVAASPEAADRSRISVLLGNKNFPRTRTVTHVVWAMFGLLPGRSTQKPHRHQSVALDYIVDCAPGCYSLIGQTLDAAGNIVRPVRQDWTPGMAFVTPPGYWHAHVNEGDAPAHLIPIQDAGLQTYLRALDIRFS
jgi:gentisate 1,2-dioxygenase